MQGGHRGPALQTSNPLLLLFLLFLLVVCCLHSIKRAETETNHELQVGSDRQLRTAASIRPTIGGVWQRSWPTHCSCKGIRPSLGLSTRFAVVGIGPGIVFSFSRSCLVPESQAQTFYASPNRGRLSNFQNSRMNKMSRLSWAFSASFTVETAGWPVAWLWHFLQIHPTRMGRQQGSPVAASVERRNVDFIAIVEARRPTSGSGLELASVVNTLTKNDSQAEVHKTSNYPRLTATTGWADIDFRSNSDERPAFGTGVPKMRYNYHFNLLHLVCRLAALSEEAK
ncbi:unnamed protein product [Protopolystoma xenopodis]|uniref:Uncharacterized protein n=1 Tax=Protopolystoma xenopodis TaxID=117903 RepID=A0A448XMG3_9PLAT|nr:unnamed protein product [Protopolystoma xenopodis]